MASAIKTHIAAPHLKAMRFGFADFTAALEIAVASAITVCCRMAAPCSGDIAARQDLNLRHKARAVATLSGRAPRASGTSSGNAVMGNVIYGTCMTHGTGGTGVRPPLQLRSVATAAPLPLKHAFLIRKLHKLWVGS